MAPSDPFPAVAGTSSTSDETAFDFPPSAGARILRLAEIAERGLTGAARRLRSGRPVLEPAEWRSPARARPALPGPGSAAGPPVILLAAVAWGYRFQRPQQLARAFVQRGQPVLYVEAFSRALVQAGLFARSQRAGPLVLQLRLPGRPDPYRAVLPREAAQAAADAIVRGLRRQPAFVLAELPFWLHVAVELKRRLSVPLVYDRLDLHSGFAGVPAQTAAAEEELLRETDLVAASSQALMPRHAPAGGAILLPNAVAADDFPPAELPGEWPPRAGYVGALSEWIDAAAVRMAAERLPDWSFELAGRVESPEVEGLRGLPNVRLLGEIPYHQVPAFLARLHVLMIPFVDSPLTRAVDPVKLYEAMSVGVPIVARALPEIDRWPRQLVHSYRDPQSLAPSLAAAVAEDSPQLRLARRSAVAEETWSKRAAQLALALAAGR